MDTDLILLIALLVLFLLLLSWLLFGRRKPSEPGPRFEPEASVEAASPESLEPALRRSLAGAAGGGADASETPEHRVVWTDLGDEVLVHLDSLRLVVDDGMVQASLDLESDETGRQTLTVPIALGGGRDEAALLGVTEELPQGHEGLAARWGRSVQAAVWAGILDVAHESAGTASGIPGRIWVERGQVLFEASRPVARAARGPADASEGRP